jgi:predicted RNase H-like HicB family nuclease
MTTKARKAVDEYLRLGYPFRVDADPDGGYVISFPDLPGCMTQAESLDEIAGAADEVRRLWIETEYEAGESIPLPSIPEEFSGRFNVRLPKSLHRRLADLAEREGVSLNQLVVSLLSRHEALTAGERRSDRPSRSRRVHSKPSTSALRTSSTAKTR